MGDPVKGAIPLDGISAKAILIDRSSADGAGVLSVADRVGCAEPMHALNDVLAGIALEEEMPVVRHDAKGKKVEAETFLAFP